VPLFAILDTEDLVQESDKTRLDATKSFAAGVPDITSITIQPGKAIGTNPVPVVDVSNDGVLDWCFDFTVEVDAENNKIDFAEGTGAPLVATVATGVYTIPELAAAIQAAMRAVGALSYEVSASTDNALTIKAASAFNLLPVSGANLAVSLLLQAGFTPLLPSQSILVSGEAGADWLGKASYTGYEIERVQKKITLTVTNDAATPDVKTISKYLEIVSVAADRLFSNDDKLRKHESNILKYISEGRATFIDIHRRAQTLILAWLDTQGFIDDIGYKFTLKRCLSIEEFSEWATHLALRLIFEDMIVSSDDVFSKKAEHYEELEGFYRNRAIIRIDMNEDGRIDVSETLDTRSCVVVRR
jgi:hypothetical protein